MKFNDVIEESNSAKKREKTMKEKYGKKFIDKKKEIADAIKNEYGEDSGINPYAIAWSKTEKMREKGKI